MSLVVSFLTIWSRKEDSHPKKHGDFSDKLSLPWISATAILSGKILNKTSKDNNKKFGNKNKCSELYTIIGF